MAQTPEDILDFWLREIGSDRWFQDDQHFDALMRERFSDIQGKAAREELSSWKKTPEGMLALILLLQEFPRRMFRGTPNAFASDDLALELAREAIVHHFDDRIDKTYKLIFYLPYANSESMGDQRLSLFYIRERTKEDSWLSMAERNFNIVDHFGRFPDRNPILGRESTSAETAFLGKQAAASS
jgi:uncharacterized protein (DUF924 family)